MSGTSRNKELMALIEQHDARREYRELIPYAMELFERRGYLKDYKALRRYSRVTRCPEVLEAVDATVRQHLPDVWIAEAVKRGEVEAAIDCWFEYEDSPRVRLAAPALIDACGSRRLDVLVSARLRMADYWIGRGRRRHYQRACKLLRQLREELLRAGEPSYWRLAIDDVTAQYGSRPAFLDELEKAGLR